MKKFKSIKAGGEEYEIWATEQEVADLNNVGNAAIGREMQEGKEAVVEALRARGVETDTSMSLQELANKILEVDWNPNIGFVYEEGYAPSTVVEYINNRNKILSVDVDGINIDNSTFRCMGGVKDILVSNVGMDSANAVKLSDLTFYNKALETISLPDTLYIISGETLDDFSIAGESIILNAPNAISFKGNHSMYNNENMFKEMIFGKLEEVNVGDVFSSQANLRNISIGNDTDIDLDFSWWSAINVIAEGDEGIEELNNNILYNIINNLHDYTGAEPHTISFGIQLTDILSEAVIEAANEKNWTIA